MDLSPHVDSTDRSTDDMKGQVANVCQTILDDPSLVPERVVEAATRHMRSFGDRDFARIRHHDLDRYLEAATVDPRSDTWKFGSPGEVACYDIIGAGLAGCMRHRAVHLRGFDGALRGSCSMTTLGDLHDGPTDLRTPSVLV
jgi:hypothetical protein